MGILHKSILQKIKKNYKNKTKYINKIINPESNNDSIDYIISFIKRGKDKLISIAHNNKEIIIGNYNFYGIYQNNTKLWIWASSIPGIDRRHIKKINTIKEMSYLFESQSDNKSNFYYQLLNEDVLLINNDEQLQWIADLLLYLSDDIYYFTPENEDGNIQFITLSNIKEKYN